MTAEIAADTFQSAVGREISKLPDTIGLLYFMKLKYSFHLIYRNGRKFNRNRGSAFGSR